MLTELYCQTTESSKYRALLENKVRGFKDVIVADKSLKLAKEANCVAHLQLDEAGFGFKSHQAR